MKDSTGREVQEKHIGGFEAAIRLRQSRGASGTAAISWRQRWHRPITRR